MFWFGKQPEEAQRLGLEVALERFAELSKDAFHDAFVSRELTQPPPLGQLAGYLFRGGLWQPERGGGGADKTLRWGLRWREHTRWRS